MRRHLPIALSHLVLLAAASSPVCAQQSARDSAAVAAVVVSFHAALQAGDSAAVLRLLADDAIVLESGGVETRAEYRAHHLPADIAFAQAVPREPAAITVRISGPVAWAASTTRARGRYRERDVNSQTAELMVLLRMGDAWRISAIHWSSRTLRN